MADYDPASTLVGGDAAPERQAVASPHHRLPVVPVQAAAVRLSVPARRAAPLLVLSLAGLLAAVVAATTSRDGSSGPAHGFAVTDVVTTRACVSRDVSVLVRGGPGTFAYRWSSDDGRTSAPMAVAVSSGMTEVTVPLPALAGTRPDLRLSLDVPGSPAHIVPVQC